VVQVLQVLLPLLLLWSSPLLLLLLLLRRSGLVVDCTHPTVTQCPDD
jgi:hypothetical protein